MSVAAARPAGEMVSFETNLAPLRLRLAALAHPDGTTEAVDAELGGTGLGYFVGALLGDGRSLHDRLSGTRVVRAEAALRARVAPA